MRPAHLLLPLEASSAIESDHVPSNFGTPHQRKVQATIPLDRDIIAGRDLISCPRGYLFRHQCLASWSDTWKVNP